MAGARAFASEDARQVRHFRWPREVIAHESIPRFPGFLGEDALHSLSAISTHHQRLCADDRFTAFVKQDRG